MLLPYIFFINKLFQSFSSPIPLRGAACSASTFHVFRNKYSQIFWLRYHARVSSRATSTGVGVKPRRSTALLPSTMKGCSNW